MQNLEQRQEVNMKPRILFTLLAVAAVFTTKAESKRPNIILAMADDQGWGDMGYMGHKVLKTPVFDEMARAGLRFDRFYAAAPVCAPAGIPTARSTRNRRCSWFPSTDTFTLFPT